MTNPNPLSSAPVMTLKLSDFDQLTITLVGCGGTGSHIASGLPALAQAHGRGRSVILRVIDPDVVEPKNIGRQLFAAGDVGKNKAAVLATRMVNAYGLVPTSTARALADGDLVTNPGLNIVIGAVDNHDARKQIAGAVARAGGRLWWLDCGNENGHGHVCIGNSTSALTASAMPGLGRITSLPAPSLTWPDMLTRSAEAGGRGRGCADAVAAGEQGLMVNRVAAAHALAMLDAMLADRLKVFSVSFNLEWGTASALVIDAPTLKRICGTDITPTPRKPKRR